MSHSSLFPSFTSLKIKKNKNLDSWVHLLKIHGCLFDQSTYLNKEVEFCPG